MLRLTRDQLASLPAAEYLDPTRFSTPHDTRGGSPEQYLRGEKLSKEFGEVHVGEDSTLTAARGAETCETNEVVGHHADTASLLRGVLAGPARVVVHRKGLRPVVLKPAGMGISFLSDFRVENRGYSSSPWRIIHKPSNTEFSFESKKFDHSMMPAAYAEQVIGVVGYRIKREAVDAMHRMGQIFDARRLKVLAELPPPSPLPDLAEALEEADSVFVMGIARKHSVRNKITDV